MDTLYARFLLRWWWLITIAVVVAVVATHLAVGKQVPLYRAQATLQVGRTIQDKNPEQNEFAIMDRLVPAYAELAKRDPILIATAETLNLPLNPDQMRLRLLVTRVPSAPLIDIAVVDSDPQRAMAIANEVARQVILQSPTAAQEDQSQAFIRQQLTDLQKKISDGQAEITAQQAHIGTLTSATDVEEAQRKLSALQGQVESWQASYARLVGQVEPSRTNLVSIMSQATVSTEPLPTRNMLYYLLALVIGAGLSIVLALVLDLFDRSISSPNELGVIAEELPVLTVPRYKMPIDGGPVIQSAPTSEAAAAYRLLRNTLSASSVASGGSTIAVTSSRVSEGKTTTVSNLAVALANAGRAVILVDANLHNPDLDRHFALEGRQGFGDLLLGECVLSEAIQTTANANLSIITAGSIPANYVDLLSRDKVRDVLELLAKAAEIILFDTPAVAEEQDTLLLTKYVDGVVLVAEAGRVNRDDLTETLALLKRNDTLVVAMALNKVRLPRLNLRRAPWSRETRNRAHAQQRRQAHASHSIILKTEEL